MLTISGWLRYDALRRLWPAGVRRVLEVGCGQGALGAILSRDFEYIGLEPDAEAFAVAQASLGARVLPLSDGAFDGSGFDLVCSFEVIEHIEDDEAALARWREKLHPGGWLLVSFPAGRERFNRLDEFAGHFRRYDRADVLAKVTAAGFRDVEIVNWGFPLANAVRLASTVIAPKATEKGEGTAVSGRWLQPGRDAPLRRLLAAPFALVQRPFAGSDRGTGYVVRARRA